MKVDWEMENHLFVMLPFKGFKINCTFWVELRIRLMVQSILDLDARTFSVHELHGKMFVR